MPLNLGKVSDLMPLCQYHANAEYLPEYLLEILLFVLANNQRSKLRATQPSDIQPRVAHLTGPLCPSATRQRCRLPEPPEKHPRAGSGNRQPDAGITSETGCP